MAGSFEFLRIRLRDFPKLEVANEKQVRAYVAAFNKHDIDTMLTMVADDVEWLSINGEKVSVESRGKDELRKSMEGYFKAVPSAQSELEWVKATKSRVSALEKASWEFKNRQQTASSLSVYEFKEGLISRVYYYPPEK